MAGWTRPTGHPELETKGRGKSETQVNLVEPVESPAPGQSLSSEEIDQAAQAAAKTQKAAAKATSSKE